MAKRAPLKLHEIADPAAGTEAGAATLAPSPAPVLAAPPPVTKPVAPAAVEPPEPTAAVFARVPWSLAEGLRDLARERSKTERRRVTSNELVEEALTLLLLKEGRKG